MDHSGHDMQTHVDHSNHPTVSTDHSDHSLHSMQMFFTDSCEVTVLFQGWMTNNCAELFGSCILVIVAAVLFEGIRYGRRRLEKILMWKLRSLPATSQSSSNLSPLGESSNHPDQVEVVAPSIRRRLMVRFHLLQSVSYLLQLLLGYMLMLVAMTFNVWLFLCVCLGAFAGYLGFYFIDVFSDEHHFKADLKEQEPSHCHCG